MESQDDFLITSEEGSKETWTEWFYKNQKNIIVTSGLVFLTGVFIYFIYKENININFINISEVYVQDIDILLSSIESSISESLYDHILTIVTNISEDPGFKETGLKILEKILNTFKTNVELKTEIKDPDNFGELLRALIEEIKKK